MPEIGLNGLLLDYPHSGTAVYTRNLASTLPEAAPDLTFRLFVRQSDYAPAGIPTQRLRTGLGSLNRGVGVGARMDKFAWETLSLPIASAFRRQSLIHSLYFAAPAVTLSPMVVTVHDLIPLIVPDYHRSRQSAIYAHFMERTVTRARAIVTVSNHSRDDILRTLGVPEERVHVTYEAVDERFSPSPQPGEKERIRSLYGLPERFVLYTGGAERRKNVETLVRAWSLGAHHLRKLELKLVVVADIPPPDRLYPDIARLIRDLELSDQVQIVPSVDEADKPALYRSAFMFCFASTYEGFGFTPLEAMASGLAVIASDATSIPEVVGDAGLLLPPLAEHAWSEAIVALANDTAARRDLGQRARQRSKLFSWRRTAEQTADVYRGVLAG